MRGRQVLMQTLVNHGVERIFGNPGTTESPLLDSLLDYPSLQYVVHLHEGVAVGAANFYAQASGKTAFVNLHVAPGLGNAIGMIYGALKNSSPMVVTAGQQDTRMRLRDPVLGHDLAAIAAPVTKWSVQVESADELGPILQRAFKIANEAPAGPVFVALPINVMEQETDIPPAKPATLFDDEPARPGRHRGDGQAAGGGEEPGDRRRRRRGPRRRRQDAGRSWSTSSAPRCGSRACAGRTPSRPIIAAYRGTLAFDAPGVAKQFANNDLVLLVGGPFFEEVWYAPGSPFPAGCKVLQIEAAPPRLAYNFAVDAGVLADVGAALEALEAALPKIDGAAKRNEAMKAQQRGRGRGAKGARREGVVALADLDGALHGRDQGGRAEGRGRGRRDHHGQPRPVQDLQLQGPGRLLQRPRRRHRPGRGRRARRRGGADRSGRSCACRATARRCTRSRRCGRRRITTCRSCS